MTALEAYEESKKHWPTPEQEIKQVLSDIAYEAGKGNNALVYEQLFCNRTTKTALVELGYKVEHINSQVKITWYKPELDQLSVERKANIAEAFYECKKSFNNKPTPIFTNAGVFTNKGLEDLL